MKNILSQLSSLFSKHSDASRNEVMLTKTEFFITEPKRIYVIGDIHGCDTLLQDTLDKIENDALEHLNKQLYFIALGDYVDRGKNSKNVIEILKTRLPDYFRKIFLLGNHELYMLGFLDDPLQHQEWLKYGGNETLVSYEVKPPSNDKSDIVRASDELKKNIPDTHLEFLRNLKPYHIIDDYFFVHAGIDPDIPLDKQSINAMTTIRGKFLRHKGDFFDKKIVHGHTPIEAVANLGNRLNLDTGAYLTGKLGVAVLEKNEVNIL